MRADLLHNCLSRLLPHVDTARIALTGGVAIGLHLARHSGDRSRTASADDLDFVAESVNVIRPSVTREFLVSHFHLPQTGYPKFLVQLVDPVTCLRIDVFPDAARAVGRGRQIDIAGMPVLVLEPIDILAHKMRLLAISSSEAAAEEKHYLDATRLGALCGHDIQPMKASQLVSTAYSTDLAGPCLRCEASQCADFPLASRRAILDVLGYV